MSSSKSSNMSSSWYLILGSRLVRKDGGSWSWFRNQFRPCYQLLLWIAFVDWLKRWLVRMVKLFVVRFSMWDLQCVEKDLAELNSWGVLHWWHTCKFDSIKYSKGMLASSCLCSSVRCLSKVDLQSKPLGLSALGCCVQSGKGHAKVVVRGSVLTCLVWESRSWHHLRLEEVVVKWVNLCQMWLDGDIKLVDVTKEIGAGRRVLMNYVTRRSMDDLAFDGWRGRFWRWNKFVNPKIWQSAHRVIMGPIDVTGCNGRDEGE